MRVEVEADGRGGTNVRTYKRTISQRCTRLRKPEWRLDFARESGQWVEVRRKACSLRRISEGPTANTLARAAAQSKQLVIRHRKIKTWI